MREFGEKKGIDLTIEIPVLYKCFHFFVLSYEDLEVISHIFHLLVLFLYEMMLISLIFLE